MQPHPPVLNEQRPLQFWVAMNGVLHSVRRTTELLRANRIHLPRNRVGERVRFADGTTASVYRESILDRPTPVRPAVLCVQFRLRLLRGVAHTLFRWESMLNTPLFIGFPGFVSKLWFRHDSNGSYRGIYQWDDPARAEAYARALWQVLAIGCVPGSIHYHVLADRERDEFLSTHPGAEDGDEWWRPVAIDESVEPRRRDRERGLMMRAAVYRRFGPPEVVKVEEVPKPIPRAHEVLVRVHASTVSVADHRSRSRSVPRGLGLLAAVGVGLFRPRHRILGMDMAGVAEAIGADVTTFAPGDEVIAMLGGKFGGHAEYVCVPVSGAITAKPRNLTFEEAVTLVFGGITARAFLNQVAIKPGDTVLVNGASGAVGSAVVQLAKQLGAEVTGVCSGANRDLVTSLGADRVIDYTREDFTAGGKRYDVIVDCVGNAPFERVEGSLNAGGALLLVIADLKGILLAPWRSWRSGKFVTASVGKNKADDLAFVVGLAESGQYRPVIDRTHALADIVEAHRYVDTGRKRGNVVLAVAEGAPGD